MNRVYGQSQEASFRGTAPRIEIVDDRPAQCADHTPRLREARRGYGRPYFRAYRAAALRCTTKWGLALGMVAAAVVVWVLVETFFAG